MILLPIHIVGGLLSIISGFVALFAYKGAGLHRKSGMIFVFAMAALTTSGTVMAVVNRQPFNVVPGVLTFYLVLTGLLTVRRPAAGARWIDVGAMLVAVVVIVTCVLFI